MFVIKKIIILNKFRQSGIYGVLKLETLGGVTSCKVGYFDDGEDAYCCITDDARVLYCGRADAITCPDARLGENLQAVVCDADGNILATGSIGAHANLVAAVHAVKEAVQSVPRAETSTQAPAEEEGASQAVPQQADDEAAEEPAAAAAEDAKTEVPPTEQIADTPQECAAPPKAMTADAPPKRKSKKTSKPCEGEPSCEYFYSKIADKLDTLLNDNPEDKELEALMPGSRWVRVAAGESGYYVVGIVAPDGPVEYICYGVPDTDGKQPPSCREECRQWLEIEKNGRGYWMMYQSAKDGSTLVQVI